MDSFSAVKLDLADFFGTLPPSLKGFVSLFKDLLKFCASSLCQKLVGHFVGFILFDFS